MIAVTFSMYENIALKIDIEGLVFLALAGAMQLLLAITNKIVEDMLNQVEMHSLIPGLAKQYGLKIIQ